MDTRKVMKACNCTLPYEECCGAKGNTEVETYNIDTPMLKDIRKDFYEGREKLLEKGKYRREAFLIEINKILTDYHHDIVEIDEVYQGAIQMLDGISKFEKNRLYDSI